MNLNIHLISTSYNDFWIPFTAPDTTKGSSEPFVFSAEHTVKSALHPF